MRSRLRHIEPCTWPRRPLPSLHGHLPRSQCRPVGFALHAACPVTTYGRVSIMHVVHSNYLPPHRHLPRTPCSPVGYARRAACQATPSEPVLGKHDHRVPRSIHLPGGARRSSSSPLPPPSSRHVGGRAAGRRGRRGRGMQRGRGRRRRTTRAQRAGVRNVQAARPLPHHLCPVRGAIRAREAGI